MHAESQKDIAKRNAAVVAAYLKMYGGKAAGVSYSDFILSTSFQ